MFYVLWCIHVLTLNVLQSRVIVYVVVVFHTFYISLSPKDELTSQRNADQQDPTSLAATEGASLPSPAPQLPEQMKDQESKMDTVDEEWLSLSPRRAWISEKTNNIGKKKSLSVSPSALLSLSAGAAGLADTWDNQPE